MTLAATITTHAQHSRMAAIPATTFGTMDEEDWFGLESMMGQNLLGLNPAYGTLIL
jgi:hypothetical protein